MDYKIDLHELIQLNKVEDIISGLIYRLNSQDEAIKELQILCSTLIKAQDVHRSMSELSSSIEHLSHKVDIIRKQSLAIVDNQQIPSGELAVINYIKIKELSNKMIHHITKTDFDQKTNAIIMKTKEEFSSFREWATPITYTHKLQDEQKHFHLRIQTLEQSMPCKIDRSELSYIESILKRIELYAKFKEESTINIEHLEMTQKICLDSLQKQSLTISALETNLQTLEQISRKLAPKTETRSIAKDLQRIVQALSVFETQTNSKLDTCSSKAALNEISSHIDQELSTISGRLKDSFHQHSAHDVVMNALAAELRLKADAKELLAFVKKTNFEDTLTNMDAVVASNAKQCTLDLKLHIEDFQKLYERVYEDYERLNVAMRFIEWFTSRGESYEYNMRIIDKHLNGLAKNSIRDGATKQPFPGQIRFTPLNNSKP